LLLLAFLLPPTQYMLRSLRFIFCQLVNAICNSLSRRNCRMNHGENTEVEAQRPLLASPEAENATAEGTATGILGDDSLLGPALGA
jgi:hypothetical protein